jgi:glycosyltransferase involved in cell wall biosynthesis
VADHLAAARAVVVPSVWDEPFGRVAAEALAYGRPVITTGRGGLTEVVGDAAGWIIGTDPAALARAIDEAAGSDELVASRGAAGRARHARLFSPEATTGVLIDIYREAIAQAERRTDHAS